MKSEGHQENVLRFEEEWLCRHLEESADFLLVYPLHLRETQKHRTNSWFHRFIQRAYESHSLSDWNNYFLLSLSSPTRFSVKLVLWCLYINSFIRAFLCLLSVNFPSSVVPCFHPQCLLTWSVMTVSSTRCICITGQSAAQKDLKLMPLFIEDALNWSKVTAKIFIMLQKIYILRQTTNLIYIHFC